MMRSIVSLSLIIISVAVFFLLTNPRFVVINELEAESAELEEVLDSARELEQLRDQLLDQYQAMSSVDLDRITKLLPDNIDNVKFILELQQVAERHNVSLQNIDVHDETDADPGTPYGSVGIEFTLLSTYEDFTDMMRQLEKSLRLMTVEEITFTASDVVNIYQFRVLVNTHWLR